MACLKFTWDTPDQHSNGRMPVLDIQLWLGVPQREKSISPHIDPDAPKILKTGSLSKIILFSFYKKPMANRCSNLARAGLPEGSKVATATAEVLGRMKNVYRELPHDELDKVLLEYMTELHHGGYPHSFRANVLQSAAAGYAKMWKLEASGSGHVNRPKHVTQSKRRAMRLAGNQTWYDGSRRCQTEKPKTKPVQRLPKPQQKSVNQPTE